VQRTPKFPISFNSIKNTVLGESFELSLVFIDKLESKRLNKHFRGKDKSTNVLSFPLSKTSGEIFIDLDTARLEHKEFDMSYHNFIQFLFIHGILHLKGMRHGAKMDEAERKIMAIFQAKTNGKTIRSRH
jgi:rRNA maturation RNase YbeY